MISIFTPTLAGAAGPSAQETGWFHRCGCRCGHDCRSISCRHGLVRRCGKGLKSGGVAVSPPSLIVSWWALTLMSGGITPGTDGDGVWSGGIAASTVFTINQCGLHGGGWWLVAPARCTDSGPHLGPCLAACAAVAWWWRKPAHQCPWRVYCASSHLEV